ncbi:DUF7576 family protein [Haloarcula nitratireducens]|uniref:Small CPxCG-related zinc finger protein n=1 Tax=Haloarcula nitratireducens TaxID=2487749 RepID=A0AAW4PCG5_9EURY|nr:hypothetical protein [Halomicroarcula nitratireducens]
MSNECSEDTTTPEGQPRRCTSCGAAIDTREWYPVVAVPGDGYRIYAFCDEACRGRWQRERGK